MGIFKGKITPGKNLERLISELRVGEEAWTEPESIRFNYDLEPYLNISYRISSVRDEKNDYTIYVRRISEEKDGFLVDISQADKDYIWSRERKPFDEEESDILNLSNTEIDVVKLVHKKPKSMEEELDDAIKNENYEVALKIKKKIEMKERKNKN